MSVQLTVQGVTFDYPVPESQNWGEDATAWAVAVTEALSSTVVPGDIGPIVSVTIQNTGTTLNVTDLVIDSGINRAALVDYYIYRVRDATEVAEVGTMRLVYKTNAGTWELDRTFAGDADTNLSITSGGQVQYNATVIAGAGTHVGNMRYRVRALPL